MQSFSRGASSSPSESAGKHFAARRAADGSLNDPHAVLLAAECSPSAESRADAAADAVATRFLDEAVLTATTTVADNRDYRQVVLVGAATDTRPFRLPWYEGTVIYLIASPETHQEAAAALKVGTSLLGADLFFTEGLLSLHQCVGGRKKGARRKEFPGQIAPQTRACQSSRLLLSCSRECNCWHTL